MKLIRPLLLLFFLLAFLRVNAQVPQSINYQTVVRSAAGTVMANTSMAVKMDIHSGNSNGQVIYSETSNVVTNQYGLFTHAIGTGTPTSGVFSDIPWQDGNFWLEVSTNAGGSGLVSMGSAQLLSVPFALYAQNAGSNSVTGPTGPQGPSGINGSTGLVGATGPQGPSGFNGSVGATGPTGPQGATGLNGTTGSVGATGPIGIQGPAGLTGTNGSVGATGPQGIAGNNGPSGIQGNTGPTGPTGNPGSMGLQGIAGPTGPQGPAGSNGSTGSAGATGPTGPQGPAASIPSHYIGELYGGGIVFYVYDNGQHGLIAALTDQSTGIRWYGGSFTNTRARASGPRAGISNTQLIIANQSGVDGGSFAATVCNEYSSTQGGVAYSDWYLPSLDELSYMYNNVGPGNFNGLGNVAGFSNAVYWSSTEFDQNNAWYFNFGFGTSMGFVGKNVNTYYVRAARAF